MILCLKRNYYIFNMTKEDTCQECTTQGLRILQEFFLIKAHLKVILLEYLWNDIDTCLFSYFYV